ncbi:hypothetical protein Dda_0468 [Drechslerella dactyloides]|uniref:GPI anchored serine-threonine rich protein n=1 Tax=Drechslerella dactyloides TaxID=74499 RepID=A0AAD6NP46_DREDA|nr:hypothetical protein Dda_0468 [Drechslerella dactyloides]
MRFTTVLSVAAVAGVSVAQSTAAAPATPSTGVVTGSSSCAAQNILNVCISQAKARLSACTATDYGCQCEVQQAVVQCYNNCPNDAGLYAEKGTLSSYCVAASATIKTTPTSTASTFSVQRSSASGSSPTSGSDDSEPTSGSNSGSDNNGPSSSSTTTGGASRATPADSAAAKITWMCASSLLAVLTAAFMVL